MATASGPGGNGYADLWNCGAAVSSGNCGGAPACPAVAAPQIGSSVAIWNGSSGADPAFVGEYVSSTYSGVYPSLAFYRDWRILPGSPLENGSIPPPAGTRDYFWLSGEAAGFSFPVAPIYEVDLMRWDGEHWGNPRVVDGLPDIGFDERHLFVCAGDGSNDSNSHNQPGFLHPGIGTGVPRRYFILPDTAGGVALNIPNRSLRVYQSILVPASPPATGNGWINPPLSIDRPPQHGALPVDFRTKYIAFQQALTWPDLTLGLGAPGSYLPLNVGMIPAVTFRLVWQDDDECTPPPCTDSYFNMQGVVLETSSSSVLLRSNMQGEYR